MALDPLSTVFGALADPTRRAILARLTEGDLSVAELRSPFAMSQPAISKHLKVLEQAGLVSRTKRRTMRLSHLQAEPLRQATVWLSGYREYWEESFERLDTLLTRLQAQALSKASATQATRTPAPETTPKEGTDT